MIVAMAIFLLAMAMIGATLAGLMIRKIKNGGKAGASQKFSFPCAAFFGEKTESGTK